MDQKTLSDIIKRAEAHLRSVQKIHAQTGKQREKLEKEAQKIHDEMARQIADLTKHASDNKDVKAAAVALEKQYSDKHTEKLHEAQQKAEDITKLNHTISDIEMIINELKKHEALFRDIQIKIQPLLDQVNRIIG